MRRALKIAPETHSGEIIIFGTSFKSAIMGALVILIYFLFPAFILYLATRLSIINKIGIVVICYIFGLIIGNIHMIPESISGLQGDLMGVTILLGIPLVLFSENVIKWARLARYTFLSLLLGVVSVVIFVIVGFFIFRERIPEIWKISGMMIGVYTGGTPNLAAIARGLNVNEELYILTHTVELAVGALVLLFLLTGAKPLFSLFMKPYQRDGQFNEKEAALKVSDFESYAGFFRRANLPGLLKALGITLVIFGAGYGLSLLFEGDAGDTAAILTVTTLGILASLVPGINRIKKSFQLGMYFIYMFCVIVASKADLRALFQPDSIELLLNIFFYILLVITGSLVLHSLLSWIFGITVDDYIMTSTALSNSPPFVPVVAAALRNKEVVIPGMIIGVIGYAIGNYLGVAVAYLLR
ncbi:MAG TPA: DUF819 family protein [Bacteroides sp.]|nr:DUF819 family protein [Bacteroides sp.]